MSLNWGLLVEGGRAKAIGVPWSEEEAKAVYELGIPADFVRQGVLTKEQYEKAKVGDQKKFRSINDVRAEAKSLGIKFSRETTRPELIELVELEKEKRNSSLVRADSPGEGQG